MSDVKVIDEEESKSDKPLIIFGRDVRQIKCFRDSFIFGICGGIAGGLACFLGTSKPMFSTHVAFASLWICVFGYWFPCRLNYERQLFTFEELKKTKNEKTNQNIESTS